MFDHDPRDRDNDDPRDVEAHWITLGRGSADVDMRDPFDEVRDRGQDARQRDPRDPFVATLELPRGLDREVVVDGRHRYELNGDDARSLGAIGVFRVIPENDLRDPRHDSRHAGADLRHLRDEGLVRSVSLAGHERGVTLTERGQHLLDSHRRDRDGEREQAFHAGVSRPRELSHDAQLYRAYIREEERLRDDGGDVRRVVLDDGLKREYQEWLQEHNRGRADSDGRPDRDAREIEDWAREHELPYFDEHVHFPDFRIEYTVDGLERHQDVEVVTLHYRGAHASGVARSGFSCYGRSGVTSGRGGRPFDPRVAEEFF